MDNENKFITLIVPSTSTENSYPSDRGGGETHSLPESIMQLFGFKKEIEFDKAKVNLEQCVQQVSNLLKDIKPEACEEWDLDSVSVSLAISSEGSIGIATAGIETSIEISFSRTKSA